MANFRYSHLFTTKIGNAAIEAAAAKLNAAEIALAIADGEEKILFKNVSGDVVSVATEEQIVELINNLQTVLSGAIEDEAARAEAAEAILDSRIESIESGSTQALDDEIARAEAVEAALSGAIIDLGEALETEADRAEAVEEALSGAIDSLDTKIDTETTRAEGVEEVLSGAIDSLDTKIDAETTRAEAVEGALSGAIDSLDSAVDAETTRAEAAEAALSGAISDEQARALGAESDLLDIISGEVEDRKAGAVASVDYDSENKRIDFYNAKNEKIDYIDATDFIKDGMIDSVTIETTGGTTYLVIVWNTDAGKETTRIDIGDIFDADNYYTKDETDDAIEDAVEAEGLRATSAETALQTALNAEITRATSAETAEATARQNADVASVAVDATAGITLTLGNGDTIVATEAEEITLSAGEF